MPKFKMTVGFDCPCYQDYEVEANTAEQAIEQVLAIVRGGRGPQDWEPHPEVGCDNYRVFDVRDDSGRTLVDHREFDI